VSNSGLKSPKGNWNTKGIALFIGSLAVSSAIAIFSLMAPGAGAAKDGNAVPQQVPAKIKLDKKFKGKLPITQLTEDEATLHALNRLGYGPRPGDVQRVEEMGLEKWIEEQLKPESIDDAEIDARLAKYPTLGMTSAQLLEEFPRPNQAAAQQGITKGQVKDEMKDARHEAVAAAKGSGTGDPNIDRANEQLAKVEGPNRILTELSMAKLDRAIYSNRQLDAVMEDFWFNHFNVFANKGDDKWMLTSYVRDTIRPHTMGKFQDLLIATAKSPAMLYFLDNWQSTDPVALAEHQRELALRRKFGANYRIPPPRSFPVPGARGPMPQPGSAPQKQERGINENYGREVMELHTVGVDAGYTQQDVIEMAKCLTGWTIQMPQRDPEYVFKPEWHNTDKKVVMGHKFNYGGERDGEEALKMLANNPHTAKFISTELARHFVQDNPPAALIEHMAHEFQKSHGDIRSVLHTMIYSPEFWSQEAYRAKVKTPFELVVSTTRALNAEVPVSLPLTQWVARMGEPLFLCQPPTGYSDKGEMWVNTGALLNRLNFALQFASDHMGGAKVNLTSALGADAATDPQMVLSRAIDSFLDNQVNDGTRSTLEARLNDPQVLQARLDDPVKHVNEGLVAGLVLGAPEFQRR
jgi:uncharacterized protein (DUF1800 family)